MWAVSLWGTHLNLPRLRYAAVGVSKLCWEKKASAQSGRQHRIESNNTKHRNNYFTWGRIMFWMLICASIKWYHLFSQISREWQLGCSTKVTVYASCRDGLFIAPWFSEQCRDKAIWPLSLSSCLHPSWKVHTAGYYHKCFVLVVTEIVFFLKKNRYKWVRFGKRMKLRNFSTFIPWDVSPACNLVLCIILKTHW